MLLQSLLPTGYTAQNLKAASTEAKWRRSLFFASNHTVAVRLICQYTATLTRASCVDRLGGKEPIRISDGRSLLRLPPTPVVATFDTQSNTSFSYSVLASQFATEHGPPLPPPPTPLSNEDEEDQEENVFVWSVGLLCVIIGANVLALWCEMHNPQSLLRDLGSLNSSTAIEHVSTADSSTNTTSTASATSASVSSSSSSVSSSIDLANFNSPPSCSSPRQATRTKKFTWRWR